ncbi:MAG: hypothetical protein DME75_03260 [Verrucomicrobia bacterium]|nr:MAG: hypothetical protein DME75_03260 [Verrucomicrobiota bacterium]
MLRKPLQIDRDFGIARVELLPPLRIGYAKFYSRSPEAVVRAYDEAGNVIATYETLAILQSRKIMTRVACASSS